MPKIPTLDIEAYYLASPIDILAELPPRTLLQELLGRALMGGIGRLYFEHKGQYGRILWSQSGILQSVLDKLPSPLFEGVILELKQLAQLSLEPLTDLQQIELERLHQGKRLLMRFRFMPGQQGEQATLQVLRGAALKFYEQQQLNRLGKDALSMAQQLQRKLDEIRTRQSGEGGADKSVDSLTELQAVLKNLNQQLQDLEGEEHQ
jgi:type II secretory ATPase GspE/PulE/Tfp pilus assembly ATPase PilB-like protein